jgi:hypothetical protein
MYALAREFTSRQVSPFFLMMAYNLMANFKQLVMRTVKGRMLSGIRFLYTVLGSYRRVKRGSHKVMNRSAEGRRRHFLEQFLENLEPLHPLFGFSQA